MEVVSLKLATSGPTQYWIKLRQQLQLLPPPAASRPLPPAFPPYLLTKTRHSKPSPLAECPSSKLT